MTGFAEDGLRPDHAAGARKHIDWAHEQQEREGDTGNVVRDDALIAVAEATLALVEQQRIANRLTVAALVAEDQRFYGQYGVSGNLCGPQGVFTLDNDGRPVLDDDIREALGR